MKEAMAGAALGLALGAASVGFAVWFGDTVHSETMAVIVSTQPVPVLVATTTLHPGVPIADHHLIERHWAPSTLEDRPVAARDRKGQLLVPKHLPLQVYGCDTDQHDPSSHAGVRLRHLRRRAESALHELRQVLLRRV